MSYVRVRPDVQSTVLDPTTQVHVALKPGAKYDDRHPLVREYPWAFESDVESASAEPGSRRNVRAQ